MDAKTAVRAEWVEGDNQLQQLATTCEELQPGNIYTRYANKKTFRRMDDFWASGDETLQQHVKHTSDERLLKAIRQAHELDIPILYAPSDFSPLHIDEQLHFMAAASVLPVMCFRRHEQGTSYILKLRIGDEVVDNLPCHNLTVIGHNPGIFAMDSILMVLGEGFSGKLLLPFTKKDTVEIPRHIENDYFRRFILRNVTKAEIEAEGFDIFDTGEKLEPRLCAETAIDGRPLLTLHFRYGDNDYLPESTANGKVTLTATDDGGFRFTRQLRDRKQEKHFITKLTSIAGKRYNLRFDSIAAMVDWLRTNGPKLRKSGFEVVQPSDNIYYIGPLTVEQSDTWNGDWLQTDVTIVLDDGRLRIPFINLRDTILRGEQIYMLPTGELLLIPEEWLSRYSSLLLVGTPRNEGFRRHRCQLTEEEISGITTIPTIQKPSTTTLPQGLNAVMRPYQTEGYQWLWKNYEAQTGCCLSDEMGLGKTLQTIALLLKVHSPCYSSRSISCGPTPTTQRNQQPGLLFTEEEMRGQAKQPFSNLPPTTSLVVAPASVVHNWRNELQRFAPSLTVCTYTGTAAARQEMQMELMQWDVVLTTYRTLVNDIDYMSEQQFDIVVFDESQTFKTATSQVHRAVARIKAYHHVALSGTPIENNLMELWSLMNVLNPPLLGSQRNFQQAFVAPIVRQMEEERTRLLRKLIEPYFLKRTKEEVLTDLPERQDEVVVCPMTDAQISQYAEELSQARNELLAATKALSSLKIEGELKYHLLSAIQKLRRIANGEGKMTTIFDYLENLRGTGHKVLLFSEYVSMLERVGDEMKQRGWTYDMLTGKTHDREQVIDHFMQTPDCQFFLISLKAGGVGLNLTAADYVMLLDPWWNQAAEEQAIARAHRIGQHNPVFVYRFVSENTLEQQILTLQERKQTLIDSVMPFIYTKE
jgi:superfamily II DNA or RNA helicase